ncbi:MAG: hypothetical protein GW779_01130 [Candidatus Altiarchaeum hamiconexum]|uniref:Zn-ribbon containing protein n=1 Tax=Candidatus Altarchaeum hamiconexum TaxID=1803513 RepID=A0A8J7YWA7_9ARCH|nr:hypothetical protein [Candidatus Altarchaeum hamiconexum]NCT00606.1 hypothetical protein [Candidatus Altarchaeum hamiconexum]OIQ05891.1 MAG: hypothetical protein AUK59_02045 [Candidatus Altarchaeum sp. CG2_30_32_3053]PIZ29800.1 MAG: hypothetical protein COY41_05055 [Candidatus Altarchaeum sp. CG_4_10_14_0_8_um_filter_32_851]
MAHKCLKCNKIYSDEEILTIKQCITCGGRFFLSAKTDEELLRKEDLRTPEEKAFGVAGEVEVRRVGDIVFVKKIPSEAGVEKEIKNKEEEIKAEIKAEIKEKEKPEILEAPSPGPAISTKEFYGWKKYGMEKEEGKTSQMQTSEQREIEENKLKIESIMEKQGIEDIHDIKAVKPKTEKVPEREKAGTAGTVKVIVEKAEKVAEEKPEPIVLSDEEWLEKVFKDKPDGVVTMDIETLKILKTGKYEIDVPGLMGNKPVIAALREGTYYIDIHSAIEKFRTRKKRRG